MQKSSQDIHVEETSQLLGSSQATASGFFVFKAGTTLIHTAGDLIGGDRRIDFPRPDASLLKSLVNDLNPALVGGKVVLNDKEIVGYDQYDLIAKTVALSGSATLVMFDSYSVTFLEKVCGPNPSDPAILDQMLDLSIIAFDGGSITFNEKACIRGLIWAEGDITLAERSIISGAVVSAGGSVTVAEQSSIAFNRSVFNPQLLPGFQGLHILLWQEE